MKFSGVLSTRMVQEIIMDGLTTSGERNIRILRGLTHKSIKQENLVPSFMITVAHIFFVPACLSSASLNETVGQIKLYLFSFKRGTEVGAAFCFPLVTSAQYSFFFQFMQLAWHYKFSMQRVGLCDAYHLYCVVLCSR